MPKNMLPVAPEVHSRPGVSFDLAPSVLQRWNPAVRAASESDADNTISILDPIGYDAWSGEGATAKRISSALRFIGADQDVVVNLNSPGGDYFEGLAIYNVLREHKGKVTIRILGVAASAASVIAMAGDEVQIGRAAFFMIHNAWILTAGNRHELRAAADWIEPFDKVAVDIYAARTGLPNADIEQMLDGETWIGGADAIEQGFADEFLPSDQITDAGTGNPAQAATRRLDAMLAKQGMPRSARRQLIQEIKSSTHDAAGGDTRNAIPTDTPRAVAPDLSASLSAAQEILKSLNGDSQ